MLFQSRVLHVAKDVGFAEEYEDAFCVDDSCGRAAIADGVSAAVFSGQWGRILTEALVRQPPDLNAADAFRYWLKSVRAAWTERIDFPRLPINLQTKLRKVGGAFCTVLWSTLERLEGEGEERFRLRAYALGDTSLFHVRNGTMLTSFPMTRAADFDADPMSLCSVDWNRDQELEFRTFEADCESGDLLVLATDAVAKWVLATLEAGEAIDWNSYWRVDESAWISRIESLRSDHRMRRDDTTMMILAVGQPPENPAGCHGGLVTAESLAESPAGDREAEHAEAGGDSPETRSTGDDYPGVEALGADTVTD